MRSFHQPLLGVILALFTTCGSMESIAAGRPVDASGIAGDFEAVLDLWRDGRYGELYDRTYAAGTRSRESFIGRMSVSGRKPACCWEKLQDLKITGIHGDSADLYARVGMEGFFGKTEYSSRSFRMRREDGIWKISMSDILSLSGKNGRKRTHIR